MSIRKTLSLIAVTLAFSAACSAQINMAALAQFKQNQQKALAESLQPQTTPGKTKGKPSVIPAGANPLTAPGRPAIIKAKNPVYKSNYSDMHFRNVR